MGEYLGLRVNVEAGAGVGEGGYGFLGEWGWAFEGALVL